MAEPIRSKPLPPLPPRWPSEREMLDRLEERQSDATVSASRRNGIVGERPAHRSQGEARGPKG